MVCGQITSEQSWPKSKLSICKLNLCPVRHVICFFAFLKYCKIVKWIINLKLVAVFISYQRVKRVNLFNLWKIKIFTKFGNRWLRLQDTLEPSLKQKKGQDFNGISEFKQWAYTDKYNDKKEWLCRVSDKILSMSHCRWSWW